MFHHHLAACCSAAAAAAACCTASSLQLQVWKATVYLTPLLGGYLADAGAGK
jgi:dipeptide/tripeptide permease